MVATFQVHCPLENKRENARREKGGKRLESPPFLWEKEQTWVQLQTTRPRDRLMELDGLKIGNVSK